MINPESLFRPCVRRALACALLVMGAAAGTCGAATPAAERVPAWPAAPERARVRFVDAFGESPKSARSGFFARIVDFLFGSGDDTRPQLRKPSAVAVDTAGVIYVSDLSGPAIYRIPTDGSAWESLGGDAAATLRAPVGVAVWNDSVFVADAQSGKILEFTTGGDLVRVFDPGLKRPAALAVDSAEIYVVDAVGAAVHVFDHAGVPHRTFGADRVPGGMNTPTNIVVKNERVYVVDAMNFRVVTFSTDGTFQTTFGSQGDTPGYLTRPRGIAVDPDGHVYVADAMQDNVQIFSPTGDYLLSFCRGGFALPGLLQMPAGVAISRAGKIVVADSYNHRVQVFQYLP